MNYAEGRLKLSGVLSVYYQEGAYHWAEAQFDLEKTTQTSSLRSIHALSLLDNAKVYTPEEVAQASHIRKIIESGYISSLASEVMEHSDIRRCHAKKIEHLLRERGFTTRSTELYEEILIQISDKVQMESLWRKALDIEEKNKDRDLPLYACFDTNKQFNTLLSMGAQKIFFKDPMTGQPFPLLILQPAPKSLPWTMDDATWNAARKEIRAEAHARWAQRFAENNN